MLDFFMKYEYVFQYSNEPYSYSFGFVFIHSSSKREVHLKSKWIEHKGKRIFLADYSGFTDFEKFKAELDYSTSITINEPKNSVLLLCDVTGTIGHQEMIDYLTKSASKDKDNMKKTAVIGVSGYRKIFLRAVVQFARISVVPFDDIEQAKDWLVRED